MFVLGFYGFRFGLKAVSRSGFPGSPDPGNVHWTIGGGSLSLSPLSRLSLGVAQGTEPCAIRRRKLRKPTGMVENEGGGVDDG